MEPLNDAIRQEIHREVNWFWQLREYKPHRAALEMVSFHLDALIALLHPAPELVARYKSKPVNAETDAKGEDVQGGTQSDDVVEDLQPKEISEEKRKRGRPPDPRAYNSDDSLDTLSLLNERQRQLGGTEIGEIVGSLADLHRYVNAGPPPKGRRGNPSLPLWKQRALELLVEQWKLVEGDRMGVEFDDKIVPKSPFAVWIANEAKLVDPLAFPGRAWAPRETSEKITDSNVKTVLISLRKRQFPPPDRNWR